MQYSYKILFCQFTENAKNIKEIVLLLKMSTDSVVLMLLGNRSQNFTPG